MIHYVLIAVFWFLVGAVVALVAGMTVRGGRE